MKKTCDGCRALDETTNYFNLSCRLGYQTTPNGRPLEECPKPRTIKEYVKIKVSK